MLLHCIQQAFIKLWKNIEGIQISNLQAMFFAFIELIQNTEQEYPNIDKKIEFI
jgi:hypothetical protein